MIKSSKETSKKNEVKNMKVVIDTSSEQKIRPRED